ncbi:group 1 truncated hemoglobin [Massilia glaciei]|uniref:Group 1 truncated hemoglobin n=2 Tax=Massilia glaciei TaxID=1524097 RepID=A0A2U2HFY5_9BURK|nr:group 1 truncated hemoglobin [Massilia glaciei]
MRLLPKLLAATLLAASSLAFAHAPADDSLYIGLGAKEGIRKIVATFVPLVLADARIKESFSETDIKNLTLRLEQQFCVLAGGPCEYKGSKMTEVHDGLNVTNAQFNALTEDLQIAMERNGVPSRIQNKLVALLAPMQRGIVTK